MILSAPGEVAAREACRYKKSRKRRVPGKNSRSGEPVQGPMMVPPPGLIMLCAEEGSLMALK